MLQTKWIIYGLVAVRLFSGGHRNWIELGADCDHGHGGEFCNPLRHPSRPPIVGRRRTDHGTRPRADRERMRFAHSHLRVRRRRNKSRACTHNWAFWMISRKKHWEYHLPLVCSMTGNKGGNYEAI